MIPTDTIRNKKVDLIDTLWNVKDGPCGDIQSADLDLIDTLWNVKK